MGKKDKQVSLFSVEGRFLGFLMEDGYKIKYLRLATTTGELCIKLSKESRASVGGVLTPGDWIQVWGEKTIKGEDGAKLKADKIRVAAPGEIPPTLPDNPSPAKKITSEKATVLVCQKSDCMKRGGKAICQALAAELSDRDLTAQVTVRGTGCMKECKAGPNLVIMPGKSRYSRISARDIPALLDKHFPGKTQQKDSNLEGILELTSP